MKLTELWQSKDGATLSYELFPARTEKAAGKLAKVLDKLAATRPDFVAVTFGAGGSTRDGSRQLVQKLIAEQGLPTIAYFACFGLGPDDITGVIDDYQALGVQTILAVRGDPPHGQDDFQPHPESLAHASDLLGFLRPRYPDLCLGCAGYPEGHIDAESKARDLEFLKLKVEKGAQFIITNYTYNNQHFFDFLEQVRGAGIEVPVLPGVMPIYNVKMMQNLAALCGAEITEEIRDGLAALPEGDKAALSDFGIDLAYRQCKALIEGGAPGVHLYTMDRAKSVVAVVERLRADGVL